MSTTHVLIIEDDANNIEVLGGLLEEAGVTYSAIQDPQRLDEVLATVKKIDIVFLDLELPHLDGYETLQILKEKIGMTAPIIAYTVYESESVQARRMGFDGFLGKPLDYVRFPEQLRRILNGETVWDTR